MARTSLLLALVLALALVGVCPAAQPSTLSYQGVLRDGSGNIVTDGNYSMTFKIYDVVSGGAALWTETQTVAVADGIFNVILGKTTALGLAFDQPYWLGTAIAAGAELSPRVELTAAPYAFHAKTADVGSDNDWTISGNDVYRVIGNVGIGTSAPTNKLSVKNDVDDLTVLSIDNQNAGNSSATALLFDDENAGQAWVGVYDDGHAAYPDAMVIANNRSATSPIFFHAGGSERMRLTGTGDVGIGTTAPAAKLDVNGTAKVGGFQMTSGAAASRVLTSDGSGTGSWQPLPGGIGGGGTTDYVTKWTGATTLGNSIMYQNVDGVVINATKGDAEPEGIVEGKQPAGPRAPHRLAVFGQNGQSLAADLYETDAAADGRSAIYGYRSRSVQSDGSGYGPGQTNNAITGYSYWGDLYTFGVAGYSFNDYTRTGGVLGSDASGVYWGALGYKDESSATWGIYTPGNAYVGGTLNATAAAATNADMLDSQHGAYYQNATNLNAGTIAEARLPQNAIDSSEIEDNTLASVDILDGTIASADILDGTIASADIADGAIMNADVNASAAIAETKISGTAWTHTVDGYPPRADGASNGGFLTTSGSYTTVTSVSITLTAQSVVHAVANAWAGEWDGTYEGYIGIGFGSTTPEYYSERVFDIGTDQDLTVTSSCTKEMAAGTYTIYFRAYRSSGSGQLWFPRFDLSVQCTDLVAKGAGEARIEPVPKRSPEEGVGQR
jgi:hypothetical protein